MPFVLVHCSRSWCVFPLFVPRHESIDVFVFSGVSSVIVRRMVMVEGVWIAHVYFLSYTGSIAWSLSGRSLLSAIQRKRYRNFRACICRVNRVDNSGL
ncbi:hypothetical protein K504DRAFT_9049 [Pleomassaria siparia CBS 279.74]|uniref:Uncharacterized protein n=1 Tax=Pleomassaria siparia CBS 279.74 TaxID=1314801 RepID=A0A6G1KPH0_9PLEO|nr:hypothetical protein K504DRAFT_9049 [Pleomassaria siparia CBS 279.74]